jgi:hypothetical protein
MNFINSFSLHDETLAVSVDNQTHIFVEQNVTWVERTVLDEEYRNVAVSGQNLNSSNHDIDLLHS